MDKSNLKNRIYYKFVNDDKLIYLYNKWCCVGAHTNNEKLKLTNILNVSLNSIIEYSFIIKNEPTIK